MKVFRKPLPLLLLAAFLVLLAGAAYRLQQPDEVPPGLMGVLRQSPLPLHPFRLEDHRGRRFDENSLRGKWSFVFFGYTSCPDICPMTLHTLKQVYDRLTDETRRDTQVVFVSVDPARDSREKLAAYIAFFNRDFIAASGEKSGIDRLARQFNVTYVIAPESTASTTQARSPETRFPEQEKDGNYTVLHSSAIFLVDPSARLVATFSQPHRADTLIRLYRQIRAFLQ